MQCASAVAAGARGVDDVHNLFRYAELEVTVSGLNFGASEIRVECA